MVVKNEDVILIPLEMINDNKLSFQIRGFLCCICSFNRGKLPTIEDLCKITKENKETVLRLIHEGIKLGYLSKKSIELSQENTNTPTDIDS